MADAHDDLSGRDQHGRFAAGNPGGPGNPSARHARSLRQAAVDAVKPEHVGAILRLFTRRALEGDVKAARLVLERVLGKPTNAPTEPEPLPFSVSPMRTAADCATAATHIMDGLVAGTVDNDTARTMLTAVQAHIRLLEIVEFEMRLAHLEAAGSSDPLGWTIAKQGTDSGGNRG